MSKKSRKAKMNGQDSAKYIAGWIATAVQTVMSAVLFAVLLQSDLLPVYLEAVMVIALVVLAVLCRLLMKRPIRNVPYYIGIVLSLLITVGLSLAGMMLYSLTGTLKSITGATTITSQVGVYVRADDDAETMQDVQAYPFGILESLSREDTDEAIAKIESELSVTLDVTEYAGMTDLADALLSEECNAMILSADYIDMVTDVEGYEDFDEQVKLISTYEWETEVEEEEEVVDEDGIFLVYMSGIDTTGAVSTKSRSDVNIIAAVNTNTHQILLVSTPRDYYVELSISNGVKDKLTHAGIYGVDVSMDTLSMLYDTDIEYYFRVNFTGFEDIIDALGGVTVDSEVAFTSSQTGDVFVEGENTLTGSQALAFVRERKAFSSGDRQRGKNQMALIKAVVNKATSSTAVLQNFSTLLASVEGTFETNVPYEMMSQIVKDQLSDGGSWNIVSYSVDGTGDYNTTYSMNQQLYVMVPDESTVEKAKELINMVLDGETISDEDTEDTEDEETEDAEEEDTGESADEDAESETE